jgi:1-phosphatidylinositol phosphodiesterase
MHNLSSIVSKAPPQAIAENAQASSEQDVAVSVPVFHNVASEIPVAAAGEVLRLTFTVEGATFRVDLNSRTPGVHSLTPDATHRFDAVFHSRDAHLALLSTANLPSWQGQLRDDIPLSAVSTPGTHNSPTCFPALPTVRCQAVPPAKQLENGIRFFDLRCQVDGPKALTLVHGAFPIALAGSKNLSAVLGDAYSFLSKNPRETIIISLKREGRGDATDARFAQVLKTAYIDANAARWYLLPRLPTLGEARGKVVLFRRFALPSEISELGIDASNWAYNAPDTTTPSGVCRVQDFCEVKDSATISRKVGYVKDHLGRSTAARGVLFLNFLSASNFWKVKAWPKNVADVVNVETKRHLAVTHDPSGGGGTGVLLCDFVGEGGDWELVRLVVAMNAYIKTV